MYADQGWLATPAAELPSEWRHDVACDDRDDGSVFLCRWETLPMPVALLDGQGSLLGQLRRLTV